MPAEYLNIFSEATVELKLSLSLANVLYKRETNEPSNVFECVLMEFPIYLRVNLSTDPK